MSKSSFQDIRYECLTRIYGRKRETDEPKFLYTTYVRGARARAHTHICIYNVSIVVYVFFNLKATRNNYHYIRARISKTIPSRFNCFYILNANRKTITGYLISRNTRSNGYIIYIYIYTM